MRLKLDENLPVTAATLLSARGFDVDTVRDEGMTGHPDDAVWRAAQSEARFLVTQDLDFSDTRKFAPGTHHGILLVRLPDAEQWRVNDYLIAWLSDPDARSWTRCVVVATPTKVRVIRPEVSDE
jgi:predicted nuclease of predicted toxin-antitoxin system